MIYVILFCEGELMNEAGVSLSCIVKRAMCFVEKIELNGKGKSSQLEPEPSHANV
jgi:hypothetical protein